MDYIGPFAVILGGILAASGWIVSKKPNAKELIDKIVPFQGFIGVGLLAWGIYDLIRTVSWWGPFLKLDMLLGVSLIGYVLCEILLGFLLGFGLIAKWIPGEGAAETKALELQKKVMAYQVPIGAAGIVLAVLFLMYRWGIL